MKNIKHILPVLALAFASVSCVELDRYPLDQGSSQTWLSTETEFDMSVADIYRPVWWDLGQEAWSDDYFYRKVAGQPMIDGTLNSATDIKGYLQLETYYTNLYKAIVRANVIINNIERGRENGISDIKLAQYEAQARFTRAYHYGVLAFLFGDVVYVDKETRIEDSYTMEQTPRAEVIKKVYNDFDFAINTLPEKQSGMQTATKGAALALKARFALYFGDWEIASEAAKQCIALADKGIYRLNPDFGEYFHSKADKESIFLTPCSDELEIYASNAPFSSANSYVHRGAGGSASKGPSWALFATFECTDGLTIDKSPLFDPHNPFKNRDPRCAETIIEFGTAHLGVTYDPRPSAIKIMDYNTGKMVNNKDNYPGVNSSNDAAKNASYNGIMWKKRTEWSWSNDLKKASNDNVIIRLADVYLIYAEAMIEQNKIDDSVLEAINKVRARAYKCQVGEISKYPSITTKDQKELRKIVRRERRVELAFECLRYYDCIRWRIAEKAFNMPNCGLLSNKKKAKALEDDGHWFWEWAPEIDEDGIPNFQKLINAGYCDVHSKGNFSERMYRWPIPAKEMMINDKLVQNDGY